MGFAVRNPLLNLVRQSARSRTAFSARGPKTFLRVNTRYWTELTWPPPCFN
jgi:hypothetical protein